MGGFGLIVRGDGVGRPVAPLHDEVVMFLRGPAGSWIRLEPVDPVEVLPVRHVVVNAFCGLVGSDGWDSGEVPHQFVAVAVKV